MLVLFYLFLKIFQIIQQLFDFNNFNFWSFGELRALLPPKFGHLGNNFKKSVGDLIFYDDSTYKIKKKQKTKKNKKFEGTFPPGHNYVTDY